MNYFKAVYIVFPLISEIGLLDYVGYYVFCHSIYRMSGTNYQYVCYGYLYLSSSYSGSAWAAKDSCLEIGIVVMCLAVQAFGAKDSHSF